MPDVTAFWLRRDFVRVSGPDATDWLQGQLSQDLSTVPIGGSALSFLLQPQGKVDALLRVARLTADEFVLDVDGGFGPDVEARLRRFKLRVKAELEPLAWRCLAVRGPDVATLGVDGLAAPWHGRPGVDLVGAAVEVPTGLALIEGDDIELTRIEAGVPMMGAEITEKTIPAELGPWIIEHTVSFTKGCYTGQELVARIESRGGHVPRQLRRLIADQELRAGAAIKVGDKVVGAITSAATRPAGGAVALGFVGRDVEVGAEVQVVLDGEAGVTALVAALGDRA